MNCHQLITLLTLITISFAEAKFNKTNTIDSLRCKVHKSISEDNYKVFYNFIELEHNNTLMDNDTLSIDFHFSVLADSNAHIMLAPSTYRPNDPAYEIVLDCGSGGLLRRNVKYNDKATTSEFVLSPIDIRSFWIHVNKTGWIDVGREGDIIPFMSWKDPNPLPISIFSFRTVENVQAKWFFDCPTLQDKDDGYSKDGKETDRSQAKSEKYWCMKID